MFLNKLENFVKKFFLNLDHLFQEIDHDEKMYLAIINSLNKKIIINNIYRNVLHLKYKYHFVFTSCLQFGHECVFFEFVFCLNHLDIHSL